MCTKAPPLARLRFVCAALAFAGLASQVAAEDTYVIDGTHTTPMFEIMHLSMTHQRGFFTDTTGRITLDREARRGSISVEIGTGSVMTASRVLTEVLKREDYFNAGNFPVMTYRAREIDFEGDVPVAAHGLFTLLGVTRPVTLAITGFRCGTHPYTRRAMCGAEATTTIRRSEFGMTAGLPTAAGDEVRIVIPIEAMKD
jgi:polyisoprenoid-binding protein YceI